MTFMMLFLQGMMFWFLSSLSNFRCKNDYIDYFTGEPTLRNSTNFVGFLDVTCKQIHIGDRVVLFIECALMVSKNVWFLLRVMGRNMETLKKKSNFVNLVAIDKDHTKATERIMWQPVKIDVGGGIKIAPSSMV